MRAITWVELNAVWYGVLSRAGQRIPEGKPNYGVIAYDISPGFGDSDSAWSVSDRIGFTGLNQRAQSITEAKARCERNFRDWMNARGLIAQIDLDYDRVFTEVRGFWQDLGTIAERVGTEITYERVFDSLCLLIADGKVELKEGSDGVAPTYRATLQ